jgi:hypothetical protein
MEPVSKRMSWVLASEGEGCCGAAELFAWTQHGRLSDKMISSKEGRVNIKPRLVDDIALAMVTGPID